MPVVICIVITPFIFRFHPKGDIDGAEARSGPVVVIQEVVGVKENEPYRTHIGKSLC